MNYNVLLEILLSDNVYTQFKQNEQQIFELIPELKVCKGFEQNNKWHIYDVYEHILHVVSGVENNIYLRLAALFHDIGKPLTYTEDNNGVGHFYNHWDKSVEIFKRYEDKFGLSNKQICLITNLIFYHDINIENMTDKKIKCMINKIGIANITLLFSLKRADLLAQSPEFHNLLANIDNQELNIFKMKRKKITWTIILIIGIIPFVIPLIMGIYNSINGYSGLCWWDCDYYYGIKALVDSMHIYSYIFWPTYIIGAILIIFSIIKLKAKKSG